MSILTIPPRSSNFIAKYKWICPTFHVIHLNLSIKPFQVILAPCLLLWLTNHPHNHYQVYSLFDYISKNTRVCFWNVHTPGFWQMDIIFWTTTSKPVHTRTEPYIVFSTVSCHYLHIQPNPVVSSVLNPLASPYIVSKLVGQSFLSG